MANKSIDISNLIAHLRSVSAISSLVWNRIFYWPPMREQSWIYLQIAPITQISDITNKVSRVEFRYCASDENTTPKQLISLQDLVTDEMITNWVNCMSGAYKIIEWSDFREFVDDKNKNILIRDYQIYFLS